MTPTGYKHPSYAASLSHLGEPLKLPRCGGWVLRRTIGGSERQDAIGPYPLFACDDWSQIGRDVRELRELVSLTLVADPLAPVRPEELRRSFGRVRAFKEHFVVDLGRPPNAFMSPHHRRNVRKALSAVDVERSAAPETHLTEWLRLYRCLAERRGVRGAAAFPEGALGAQLRVPGIDVFRAVANSRTVGMSLWYRQDNAGYYHLGACDERGYRLRASHALMWAALEHFKSEVAWLDLGGGPGSRAASEDGLVRFKRGWATGTRTAYLCGEVFDEAAYRSLVHETQTEGADYFPQYRAAEAS